MVKTTLELKDELYKKLVNEAINKYGNTKSLSRVINENLETHMNEKKLAEKDSRKRKEAFEKAFGIWKLEKSGKEYVRELRDESEKRRKRLGL